MAQYPKVSVLTPLYNTNPVFLREMIESVLKQTYGDFEFILLNDSPDNTEIDKIVNSYDDRRIRYLKNEKNLGISESRNKLLDLAKGEYIAIFDHDDISMPERLQKEVEFLDKNPKVGVVSSNWETYYKKRRTKFPQNNSEIKTELVIMGCVIVHSASMIRKHLLTDNNIRYEEEFTPCEDYMLFGRLIDKTMFYNFKTPLIKYRDYDTSTSHKMNEIRKDKENMIKNILYKQYPYFSQLGSSRAYLYLFGFIPIIKQEKLSNTNKERYYLFNFLPLIKKSK